VERDGEQWLCGRSRRSRPQACDQAGALPISQRLCSVRPYSPVHTAIQAADCGCEQAIDPGAAHRRDRRVRSTGRLFAPGSLPASPLAIPEPAVARRLHDLARPRTRLCGDSRGEGPADRETSQHRSGSDRLRLTAVLRLTGGRIRVGAQRKGGERQGRDSATQGPTRQAGRGARRAATSHHSRVPPNRRHSLTAGGGITVTPLLRRFSEGLFGGDPGHRRAVPRIPRRVGLIDARSPH
jgi:hypothetical protein